MKSLPGREFVGSKFGSELNNATVPVSGCKNGGSAASQPPPTLQVPKKNKPAAPNKTLYASLVNCLRRSGESKSSTHDVQTSYLMEHNMQHCVRALITHACQLDMRAALKKYVIVQDNEYGWYVEKWGTRAIFLAWALGSVFVSFHACNQNAGERYWTFWVHFLYVLMWMERIYSDRSNVNALATFACAGVHYVLMVYTDHLYQVTGTLVGLPLLLQQLSIFEKLPAQGKSMHKFLVECLLACKSDTLYIAMIVGFLFADWQTGPLGGPKSTFSVYVGVLTSIASYILLSTKGYKDWWVTPLIAIVYWTVPIVLFSTKISNDPVAKSGSTNGNQIDAADEQADALFSAGTVWVESVTKWLGLW